MSHIVAALCCAAQRSVVRSVDNFIHLLVIFILLLVYMLVIEE